MNRTIFWRLMWKEYRLQRSFWIAMAVLAMMLMFYVWEFQRQRPAECAEVWFSLALGIPIFYGLGCASTAFAGEHDAETFEFQRSLPVRGLKVFWGKIAFTAASTAVMVVFLLIISIMMAGEYGLSLGEILSGAAYGSAIICLFTAWGAFFSLLIKRPLLSAVVAVSVATICLSLVLGRFPRVVHSDYSITLIIGGISFVIALVDYWLGRQWFFEMSRRKISIKILINSKAVAKPETLADYLVAPNRWNMILRLGWYHWRESAWMLIVIAVMMVPLALIALVIWDRSRPGRYSFLENQPDWRVNVTLVLILALAMPPLVGAFTFLGDQRRRYYRFFAERGIGPRTVWLSRLWPWLVMGPCIFALMALLITPIFLAWPWDNTQWWRAHPGISPLLWRLLAYVVLSICAGQLCSMFFRSGILAGLFGLILGAILGCWVGLMWLWDINWLWSIAPIPLVLLFATWLRASDWVLERDKPRFWLRPALALVVPAIILLSAVPLYRAYQIPVVDPGFSIDEFTRPLSPEEQATFDLFEKAATLIDPKILADMEKQRNDSPAENVNGEQEQETVYHDSTIPEPLTKQQIDWVENNPKVIQVLIEASKGPRRIYSYPAQQNFFLRAAITDLVVDSARMLESEGRLDEALERYMAAIRISRQLEEDFLEHRVCYYLPFWATRPKQTPERVKNALRQFKELTADQHVYDRPIKSHYMGHMELLTKGFESGQGAVYLPVWSIIWEHLPWERARAIRLLNLLTHDQLEAVQKAEMDLKDGRYVDILQGSRKYYSWEGYSWEPEYALHQAVNVPPLHYTKFSEELIKDYALLENHRRATLILLALQVYKLDRGTYPKTLDELAGTYLDRLPIDPYSVEPYRYYPDGLKVWMHSPGMDFQLISSGMDKPFIWSASTEIHVNPYYEQFMERYFIYERDLNGYTWGGSIFDILSHGHSFFLP
jgi:hypothetical protein